MLLKSASYTVVAALIVGAGIPAQAQPLELRVGDSLPPDHIITRFLTKAWMEDVEKASKGAITIKHYPAEQAGKARDMLALTQSGVVDIGYIGPAYVADKMPLSGVAELPGLFKNSCQVTKAYWSMAKPGGYFFEKEFQPNKVRPLFLAALPPYQMDVSSARTINDLANLEGLKIRAAGGAQELTLRKLGVVPVKMAPPEIYESMSRGTIDGTLLPFISLESYKLVSQVKTATDGANFGTVVVTYSISEKKWKSLSKDNQKILADAGERVTLDACSRFDEAEQQARQLLVNNGTKLLKLDNDDSRKMREVVADVGADWAEKLDKRRKPGSETLKAFNEALEQFK